jgi:diguanylate cyclase (GGDEF)-like protein/PAS domain S-box-containing protein
MGAIMDGRTKSQLTAEIIELQTRLAQLEAERTERGSAGRSVSRSDSGERERVTRAPQISEARYRRLFETAKDGILILDADNGEITDSNPFLEEMLGYSHDELLGKKLWEIGPFRDVAASRDSFRELLSNEYVRYENLPLESKGGERRHVEFVSNLYLVDHTRVIQCNIRDISARRLVEMREAEATAKLSSLVAALQKRDREMTLLSRMNDLFQSCETEEEVYRVIALEAVELFAGQGGCVANFHPSGQYLEVVARWGEETPIQDVFSLEDCWALRQGHPHEVLNPRTSLLCHHFVHPPTRGYLCLPLTVQGETLGVFHLGFLDVGEGEYAASRLQLAVSVGEAIKLSLSNLRLRKRLNEQATRDPLTGLFNRRYMEDTLSREVHRALRSRTPLCLAMLDLDYFKRFNDTYGHDAGDLVLREVGRMLREHLRRSDVACRYGGEEFVLVLPDSSLADTQQRLDQIRLLFERLETRHDGALLGSITLSAGVASAPEHGATGEELLRAADVALYAAKHAGRNAVVVYQVPN